MAGWAYERERETRWVCLGILPDPGKSAASCVLAHAHVSECFVGRWMVPASSMVLDVPAGRTTVGQASAAYVFARRRHSARCWNHPEQVGRAKDLHHLSTPLRRGGDRGARAYTAFENPHRGISRRGPKYTITRNHEPMLRERALAYLSYGRLMNTIQLAYLDLPTASRSSSQCHYRIKWGIYLRFHCKPPPVPGPVWRTNLPPRLGSASHHSQSPRPPQRRPGREEQRRRPGSSRREPRHRRRRTGSSPRRPGSHRRYPGSTQESCRLWAAVSAPCIPSVAARRRR
ncbi:hypothetical protein F4780DRAFT_400596 [Xylariomycetidae sp. FL0641]|nr:hypothetical protein F4780DRAFT_400596 [Xylariomycetidae sp. FL0641]